MPSHIYSMSFNATSSLLCVSSASDTIHIFKLGGSPSRRASTSHDKSSSTTTSLIQSSIATSKRERSSSPGGSETDFYTSTINSEVESAANRKHNGTLLGIIRRTSQNVGTQLASSVGAYLPSAVSEMWEPARDFAWCKIPKHPPLYSNGPLGGRGGNLSNSNSSAPLRSVVAMSPNSPQVMVVTNEGRFYVFNIDLGKGGEGSLWKDYVIAGESERLTQSTIGE